MTSPTLFTWSDPNFRILFGAVLWIAAAWLLVMIVHGGDWRRRK